MNPILMILRMKKIMMKMIENKESITNINIVNIIKDNLIVILSRISRNLKREACRTTRKIHHNNREKEHLQIIHYD